MNTMESYQPKDLRSGVCCLILVFCVFLGHRSFSQDASAVDSLRNSLRYAATAEDSLTIYCNLSWNCWSDDKKSTMEYGSKALEISRRVENKEKVGEAYDAAALGYWVNGDAETAKRLYTEELRIGEEYNIPLRIVWAHNNLAQIELDNGNYSAAQYHAERSRSVFKDQQEFYRIIRSDWFLVKPDRYNFKSFIDTTIYDIQNTLPKTEDPDVLLKRYLSLIELYGSIENRAQSLHYAVRALEVAEQLNNKEGIVTAYHEIGEYFRDYQKNYEAALSYFNHILKLYKEENNEIGISKVYGDIGNVHKLMGDDSTAIEFLNESLRISKKIENTFAITAAYKNLGDINFERGRYAEALEAYNKCYQTISGCNTCTPLTVHPILINIGQTYLKMNKPEKAKGFFEHSFSLANTSNAIYEKAISYKALGHLSETQNNTYGAIAYYENALSLADSVKYLSLQKDLSFKLSDIYTGLKRFEKAHNYLTRANAFSERYNAVTEAENISRLETRFELETMQMKNQLAHESAQQEIAHQAQLKNLFISAFIITGLLVTALYLAYKRKRHDNELLEKQKKKIEEMAQSMHAADEMKLRFFTNVSHELRTPLTLIKGITEELVSGKSDPAKVVNTLSLMQKNVNRLTHLVNQILDIRKLDNGDVRIELVQGNLYYFASGICKGFETYCKKRRITLAVEGDQTLSGWYDPDKTEKILTNLLSNAIKFSKEGGSVNVTIVPSKKKSFMEICVRDNGVGIPEDKLKDIFRPFYQVSESFKGSGIGLALVKELIDLLKGEIHVESHPSDGTKFTFELPLSLSSYGKDVFFKNSSSDQLTTLTEPTLEDEDELIINGKQTNKKQLNEKSLLIVEDNVDLCRFLFETFRSEYTVYLAKDGHEGFNLAKEKLPDIIISDVMMPGTDGFTLCKSLKEETCTSHIPVILLTAKDTDESRISGFEVGADAYISKPFSTGLLKTRVSNLLKQRASLANKFAGQFHLEPTNIVIPDLDKEFLDKTIHLIETHMTDQTLDVDFLASELAVSRTQLYRKLKALTGFSANQFIRYIKLKRAAQLLEHGGYNISQVMDKTGFGNYTYFTNCFKSQFGKSPKEFVHSDIKKA